MKMDESCINHNALKLVDELTDGAYDVACGHDDDKAMFMAMTLGNIIGVLEMAKAMKEVLKL